MLRRAKAQGPNLCLLDIFIDDYSITRSLCSPAAECAAAAAIPFLHFQSSRCHLTRKNLYHQHFHYLSALIHESLWLANHDTVPLSAGSVVKSNDPYATVITPTYIFLDWDAAVGDNASVTYRVYYSDGEVANTLLADTGSLSAVLDSLSSSTT